MTTDDLIQGLADLPEDAREDLALALGLMIGGFFVRRSLRKKGANEWQVYVASSVMGSLLVMNKRLERIAKILKEEKA